MKIEILGTAKDIAYIKSDTPVLKDVNSALDLMVEMQHRHQCAKIIIQKAAVEETFFDLSSRLAGEILQKFKNYNTRLAVVGDFSQYPSKSLRDFIYETNQGDDFYFMPTLQQALEKLGG